MDNIKFANNVSVKLAQALASTDTTVVTQALPANITWPSLTPYAGGKEEGNTDASYSGNLYGVYLNTTTGSRVAANKLSSSSNISLAISYYASTYAQLPTGVAENTLAVTHTPLSSGVYRAVFWRYYQNNWTQLGIFDANIFAYVTTDIAGQGAGYVFISENTPAPIVCNITSPTPPPTKLTTVIQNLAGVEIVAVKGFFYATIQQTETGVWEICKVTNYSSNTNGSWNLTVERGQEGSIATDFTDTAIVENRITAGTLEGMIQSIVDTISLGDVISAEKVQQLLDAVGTIDSVDMETINSTVAILNSLVAQMTSLVTLATSASTSAESSAQAASTSAASAEDCKEDSCACATTAQAAQTAAQMAATTATTASQNATAALEQIQAYGNQFNVEQVDTTNEVFVKDPAGVDVASVADTVDGLTLDIVVDDYALILSTDTVVVDGVTKSTVALYKGMPEGALDYSGNLYGVFTNSSNNYIASATYTADLTPHAISYAAWSSEELPTIDIDNGTVAIVPGTTQALYIIYVYNNGWQFQRTTSVPSGETCLFMFASVGLFGAAPGYFTVGTNAWVPVSASSPTNAPTSPTSDGSVTACEGRTLNDGYPEWRYVKNLPIDNFTMFAITKPQDEFGNGYYWFRNTWNRLNFSGAAGVSGASGAPLLSIQDFITDQSEEGYLNLSINHGLLSRDVYPDAWAKIAAMKANGSNLVLTDEAWLNEVSTLGFCDKFSNGDNVNTFRVPYVSLEYQNGGTRISGLVSQLLSTIAAGTTATAIYPEYVAEYDQYLRATVRSTAAEAWINIALDGYPTVDGYTSVGGNNYFSIRAYIKKGQTVQIQGKSLYASTPAEGTGLYIFRVLAPIKSSFMKLYNTEVAIHPKDGAIDIPLFSVIATPLSTLNAGYLSITKDNGVLSQAVFPAAYAKLAILQNQGEANIVTMAEYETELTTNDGICGKFALDTTNKQFRIPCAPGVYWRGVNSALVIGQYQTDQMRQIVGQARAGNPEIASTGYSGAITKVGDASVIYNGVDGAVIASSYGIQLDTSLLGANFSGSDTHPMSVVVDWQMKLYGTVTDASEANIAALIAATAGKLDTATYEADAPMRVKAKGFIDSTGAIISGINVISSTRETTGRYVVTISNGLYSNTNDMVVNATVRDNYNGVVNVQIISTTSVRIYAYNGTNGIAGDLPFSIVFN